MPFTTQFRNLFRRRWVRAVAIALLWIALETAVVLADGCVVDLNGDQLARFIIFTSCSCLLLMLIFVARRWERALVGAVGLGLLVVLPIRAFTMGPVVEAALYIHQAAVAVNQSVADSSPGRFPASFNLPPHRSRGGRYRNYQFHYVAFGEDLAGGKRHFRIEATRNCAFCRALKNMTVMDDGTIYSTEQSRPATSLDTLFSKPE
jgi:hypothetical protein